MPNECNCPNPPGGKVSCSLNQIAICAVINGELISKCVSIPPGIIRKGSIMGNTEYKTRISKWIMNKIDPNENSLRLDEMISLFNTGEYINHGNRMKVNFRIPRKILMILNQQGDRGKYRSR